MIVLGIDPGTKCGWCLRNERHIIASGVWDLKPRRHEGGGMRYLRLRQALCEVMLQRPAVVAYEEVRRHLGVDAAHIYGGIIAVISEECEARGIPYVGLPVSTAKIRATGKGNADKDAMVEAAVAAWPGLKIIDDNHADAIWFATVAIETYK